MTTLALLTGLIFGGIALHAERVLLPEGREKEATHIVIGKVTGVLSREAETNRTAIMHYTIELEVEIVVKTTGYPDSRKLKRQIRMLCWRLKDPDGPGAIPGPGGHFLIPKTGDRVCAFLISRPAGPEEEFDVVYPTGLELIGSSKP